MIPTKVRKPLGRIRRRLRNRLDRFRPTSRAGTGPAAPATDQLGSDPLEAAAVSAGWLLVDAHERLGTEAAHKVFGHEQAAWFQYARRTLPNLQPWESARDTLTHYQNDNNRLRFRRMLDFARPGDRIFDIGVGRGYLCGVLLRDTGIAAYHGIDILDRCVESTQEMLAANQLDQRKVEIELADLYALTPARVARSGASLMICGEVLEHVPDPERALRVLAEAVPDGADLIFSVPLYGRLEAVWGHVTTFDVARLKAMIRAAGLTVHHVEPLANVWTLVVASRSRRPSRRVRDATGWQRVDTSVPLHDHRDFVKVDLAAVTLSERAAGADCTLEPVRHGRTVCQVIGPDSATGEPSGGVGFPVSGLTAMRLEIGLLDGLHLRKVHVDLHTGADPVGRWTWQPAGKELTNQSYRRFAFRPGEPAHPAFGRGVVPPSRGINRVEVLAEVAPGHRASFSLRAAYLP